MLKRKDDSSLGSMVDLTELKSCQPSNQDENMIQVMILSKNSKVDPSVILSSDPEVVAVDADELKKVDQFHGEELEEPWKLISCGNKSSRNASLEHEVSRWQTSDMTTIPEDDESNPCYTRSNDRITKSSSTDRWDMPEHLLSDILIWLPVAILLQFKSVCKSWCALIGSSSFVGQHLDHSCSKDSFIGFDYGEHHEFVGYDFRLVSGSQYENWSTFDCAQFVKNPLVSYAFSADGIVCLMHSDPLHSVLQDIALWNPAMKQVRPVPKSSVPYQPNDHFAFYGFGYNAKCSDYKIVRSVVRKGNVHKNVVEVYSMRADSWRCVLEDAVLPFEFLMSPTSKSGTCFWVASYDDGFGYHRADSLVSFDLNDETFGTMALPENDGVQSSLDFLGDKLGFICALDVPEDMYSAGPRHYEIWVLHEYGVKESWVKLWKIGPTDDVRRSHAVLYPFWFSKNGDYLLLTVLQYLQGQSLHGGDLHLYNLGTTENEYLELHQGLSFFIRFTESLVSVIRSK